MAVVLMEEFFRHPKTVRAGGEAAWLFAAGIGYSKEYLTAGRIPKGIVPTLTDRPRPARLARKLVEVGYWHEHGHGCEGCPQPEPDEYLVHDWEDWNRRDDAVRSEEVKAGRRSRSEVNRANANARWHPDRNPNRMQTGCESDASRNPNRMQVAMPPNPLERSISGLNHQSSRAHEGGSLPLAGDGDIDLKQQVKGKITPARERWLGLFRNGQRGEANSAYDRCLRWFDEAKIDAWIGLGIEHDPPRNPRWLLATAARNSKTEGIYPDPSHEVYADLAKPL